RLRPRPRPPRPSPTRRPSDLSAPAPPETREPAFAQKHDILEVVESELAPPGGPEQLTAPPRAIADRARTYRDSLASRHGEDTSRDRKSTRLNSSHVKNSHAGF